MEAYNNLSPFLFFLPRRTHFKDLSARARSGTNQIRMGGALIHSVPKSDDPTTWDFAGSTIVMKASSREEVLEELKKDVYATSGVWDMEKVRKPASAHRLGRVD